MLWVSSLCGAIRAVVLHWVYCWFSLSATSAFSLSSARCRCHFCLACCFLYLGSSRMANSQDLNSLPGSFIHSCLDNSHEEAIGQGTSRGLFRYSMCSLHSLVNWSFGDGSSCALVNPCGCWQFREHWSKCTSQCFHSMEGLWYFNQSVPRRISTFPRLVMNIWTHSVCVLPHWSYIVRFTSRLDHIRLALLIMLSMFWTQIGWVSVYVG